MPLPATPSPLHSHPLFKGQALVSVVEWNPESVASLDWYRLAELLRAIAANAGCQLGPSRVNPDGSVQFAMLGEGEGASAQRSLVRLSAWNQWGATPESVSQFAWEVGRIRERTHGILVAPGGATPAAFARASELGIEIVDVAKLCRTLHSLHPEQANFFHELTLSGDCTSPTCPVCLRKLTKVQQTAASGPLRRPAELTYQVSAVVPEPVDCDRLEVLEGCEVTFLQEVRARQAVTVYGHVSGDFICMGVMTLMPGSALCGTVAAKGFDVRDGASFRGESRILDTVRDPVNLLQPSWYWRCQNPAGNHECRGIVFEPH
jgi:hypothetical protein